MSQDFINIMEQIHAQTTADALVMAMRIKFPDIKNLGFDIDENGNLEINFEAGVYTEQQVRDYIKELQSGRL